MMGGMSWASTAIYYNHINRGVRRALGGRHSAPLLIESFDFEPLAAMQAADDWDGIAAVLTESARRLEDAGVDGLILCTNTMHKLYDRIAVEVEIPILHVADETAAAMQAAGVDRAALLGTRFTMTEDFYVERIERHGIRLGVPDREDMAEVDRIIFDELTRGEVTIQSKRALRTLIAKLDKAGAEAVVLGCTELVMLVDPHANLLPIFDTTEIHAEAALRWILEDAQGQKPLDSTRPLAETVG